MLLRKAVILCCHRRQTVALPKSILRTIFADSIGGIIAIGTKSALPDPNLTFHFFVKHVYKQGYSRRGTKPNFGHVFLTTFKVERVLSDKLSRVGK